MGDEITVNIRGIEVIVEAVMDILSKYEFQRDKIRNRTNGYSYRIVKIDDKPDPEGG